MLLGIGLDRLACETGFTDGDSGLEIIGYLAIGSIIGLSAGACLAGVYLNHTR